MQCRDKRRVELFPVSMDDWDIVKMLRTTPENRNRCLSELIKRHYALVVNIGFRFFSDRQIAEDMAQEVFLKVHNTLERVSVGKQPFINWLCRITTNTCRSWYRRQASESRALDEKKIDFWHSAYENTDRGQEDRDAIFHVNNTLQKLSPKERMSLILTYIAELPTSEIAAIMNLPEYSVRRLVNRSEEAMRKQLAQQRLEKYALV
ncbi:MAG: sigma-70 family RNA polymerase sigma factor [Chitinispirillaceae bacterium]|nr:sigma-70 family RNA polymerase sigma factor [Chitinispirillaceae bacterium]